MEFREQKHLSFSSQTVGKIIVFSLFIFLCATAQSSLFPASGFFSASPDLVLCAVVGLAVYDGEKSGAVAGIGGGMLVEAFGGGAHILMFPLFYMLIGFTYGILTRIFLNKNFLSWVVYMLIAVSAREVLSLIHIFVTESDLNLLLAFTEIILPEFVITLIFSIPLYFISRVCARPFHKKIEMD